MAVKGRAKRQQNVTIQNLINRYAGSLLSPQDMRKTARKETNLAMQDSLRDLRTTYQRERERTLREQYAQGTYAGLLRGFGAPGSSEAEGVRNAYARAAALNQAEAQGFINPTTAQQGANVDTSQASNAALAGYSGPEVAGQNEGVNNSVLTYLNSLPKGTFAAQAEARAKGLASAGAAAASPFALREAQLGQTLREMQDKYLMGRQDLNASRAGELQKAIGALRESGRGDLSTLINAMYLQNTMGKTQAELTGTYKGKPTQAARAEQAALAIKAATAQSQASDRTERAAIARMNAQTSKQRAKIAQQNADTSALAASGDIVKAEQDFRKNAQKYVAGIINVNPKTGMPRKTPPSKQTLINWVYRQYGLPLAGQYGLTKQMLATWAAQVVSTFPQSYWKKPTGSKGGGGGGGGGTKPVTELP
jgi:hypothetical protein